MSYDKLMIAVFFVLYSVNGKSDSTFCSWCRLYLLLWLWKVQHCDFTYTPFSERPRLNRDAKVGWVCFRGEIFVIWSTTWTTMLTNCTPQDLGKWKLPSPLNLMCCVLICVGVPFFIGCKGFYSNVYVRCWPGYSNFLSLRFWEYFILVFWFH